jgi:hypothetical protein
MTVAQAQRAAVTAGAVTLVAGTALTLAPARSGKLVGMEDHPGVMRAIGISDLVVAAGLLAARPRSAWLTARAALNAGLFAALTLVDGLAAATLRLARS